jgi:uncharacterized protein
MGPPTSCSTTPTTRGPGRHVTDDANDHGDPDNHKYWATRGFNSRTPKVCNTFAASAARVR